MLLEIFTFPDGPNNSDVREAWYYCRNCEIDGGGNEVDFVDVMLALAEDGLRYFGKPMTLDSARNIDLGLQIEATPHPYHGL